MEISILIVILTVMNMICELKLKMLLFSEVINNK